MNITGTSIIEVKRFPLCHHHSHYHGFPLLVSPTKKKKKKINNWLFVTIFIRVSERAPSNRSIDS